MLQLEGPFEIARLGKHNRLHGPIFLTSLHEVNT